MMETRKMDEAEALKQVLDAVCAAVAAGGSNGVAGGTIYASLMAHGCTLEQYQRLMDLLVAAGRVTRKGHHYVVCAGRPGR